MASLSDYAQALALFDACVAAGVGLEVGEGRRIAVLTQELPEGLRGWLKSFCGDQEGREGLPSYRALRAIVRAPSRAAREILTCLVAFAVGLPAPFVITFRRGERRCVCATAKAAYMRAVQEGCPAFVMAELGVAALAVEQGRAGPGELDRWLARKLLGSWRLTLELAGVVEQKALAGLHPTICFGELFDALGAELVDVELLATEAA